MNRLIKFKEKDKSKKIFLPVEEREAKARLILEGNGYAECNRHYFNAHKKSSNNRVELTFCTSGQTWSNLEGQSAPESGSPRL